MTTALHALIQERLLGTDSLDDDAITLVDAACSGDSELDSALSVLGSSQARRPRPEGFGAKSNPPGVYLSGLKVSGFRGVGPERLLEVAPGPGLTLLVGRNGCGKSSFAEGLETLLTGDSKRWAGRPKEWKDGWRNLHRGDAAFLEATFAVEGSEPVVVRRSWAEGAALEASDLRVRRGSERLSDLTALGWQDALLSFRPFLTYAELGAVLSKPSELYDSLKSILGLEQITLASERLKRARKTRDDQQKIAKDECVRLRERLGQLASDERAAKCLTAMKGTSWQLDSVEAQVSGERDEGVDQVGNLLRQLLVVELPSVEAVGAAATSLRQALAALSDVAAGGQEQSAQLAVLLEKALTYCEHAAESCPVCGAGLPEQWRRDATDRLAEARRAAGELRAAQEQRDRCMGTLKGLIPQPPAALRRVGEASVSPTLFARWQAWANLPQDSAALCEHAETGILELDAELNAFRAEVQAQVNERESAWKPIARELRAWLDTARKVEAEARCHAALKAGEKWLKAQEEELRDARFEPIEAESQVIWATLREQSNVNLAKIKLDGTGTKRRVSLNVAVDDREGVALGVMSQGELNALALSLFLPRMMLAESPFRFLIVDDPVQAMDSHKVDGLARVLQKVAATRQVIVLTHDPRLLEAVRRLQIDATVLEVIRHRDSVVELTVSRDPVQRHFDDARSVARNAEPIGPALAPRVVPLFCRLAVEAACKETIRRRRYGKGQAHDEVEQLIEATRSTHPLVALAIYDDSNRSGDVFNYLNKKLGRQAGDAFRAIKEGAHGSFSGDLMGLVKDCEKIARELQTIS